jgi:hypothetical protein
MAASVAAEWNRTVTVARPRATVAVTLTGAWGLPCTVLVTVLFFPLAGPSARAGWARSRAETATATAAMRFL